MSGDVEVADEEYQKPLAGLPGWATGTVRFAIGTAYLEAGKPTEAVRYLRTFNRHTEAHVPSLYYLGEAYEALGDVEKARLNYAAFVRWWENADPELQPWVERARQSLERLTAESAA